VFGVFHARDSSPEFAAENVGYFTDLIPIELWEFVIDYEKKTSYNASQWSYPNSAFIQANQGCVCLAEKAPRNLKPSKVVLVISSHMLPLQSGHNGRCVATNDIPAEIEF
jgi:hypothetical protein